MTMKKSKTLQHIAAVAAVLLTLLVFTAPVAGEYEIGCNSNQCGQSHVHVAEHDGKYYTDTNDQMRGAIHAISEHPTDKTLTIIGTVTSKIDLSPLGSSGSGIIIEGSENGLMKGSSGTSNGVIKLENIANLDNVVIKNLKFENGKFDISTSATSLSNLLIENCTFTGPYTPMSSGDGSAAISFNVNSGEIPYDGLVIRNNTISNYNQGISFNGGSTAEGTITIEKNIISTTGHNTIIISGSLPAKYVIQNNELTSTNNRPLNLAGIADGSKLTFTGNTITFPETYNSGESTPAIYHVRGSIVLDSSNKFFYISEPKKDVTAYSSLMKHLYLDNTGAAIYVDSVKDSSGSYYGGYVSVGLDIPKDEEGNDTGAVPDDVTADSLNIKDGYSIAKVHSNKDDGYGYHYIIGKDAVSNDEMKLTAGNFVTDPSDFVASGKVCVANVDGTFTVTDETHSISVSASSVNFGTLTEGYSNVEGGDVSDVTITVTNTGNSKVTLRTPLYDDTKFIVGSYTPNPAEIAPGDKVTFTILPQGNLKAGIHIDSITIQAIPVESGDNGVFEVYDEEVITVTFTVIEKPENEETAIVPTLPPIGVEENEDGTVTITVPEGTTDVKGSGEDTYLEIKTESDSQVTLMISGYTGDAGQYTLDSNSKIAASYVSDKPVDTNTEFSDNTVGLGVILELKKVNATLPVFSFDYDEETAEKVTSTYIKPLAMLKATHNAEEADADLKSVSLVFVVDKELYEKYEGLFFLYHVAEDGNSEQVTGTPTIDSTTYEEDGLVAITFTSDLGFSSYVLAVVTDSDGETGGEAPGITSSGSAVDTGSGNYQYYPRDVPADGIVSFGTSKVVTGIELPAGSSGKVTLNIKPTFAMPENGYYAFEIDAPGYNTDAKINGGLSFQIPVADLEAAGFTANDIVLFHGTVGEDGTITWEALPTNLVRNEAGIAHYKAAIAGCSPFYIGFVKDGSVVNTEVIEPVIPDTPETPVTPDEPEVLPPVDEPETPEQPTESPAPILAVLAGLGAAVVLRRK